MITLTIPGSNAACNDGSQVRYSVLSDKYDSFLASFLATWNDSYTSGAHESDVIDILHTEVKLHERTYARLLEGHSVSDLKNVIKSRGSQKACPLFNDILPLIVSNLLKVNVMVIENVNDVYETVIISGNPCSCHYIGVLKMPGMYYPLQEVDVRSIDIHVESHILNNVTTTAYDRENGCSNNVVCTEWLILSRNDPSAVVGSPAMPATGHNTIKSRAPIKPSGSSKYSVGVYNVNIEKFADNRVSAYCSSCPAYYRTGRWDTSDEDEFFNYYRVDRSTGDGHCLLHSIAHSYKAHWPDERALTIVDIINQIESEIINHWERYIPFIRENTIRNLMSQMYDYTRKKIYDSDLGDLIPQIISDSLNIEIMIVERTPSGYRACVVVPGSDIVEHRHIFILHRERDHYDSITPFHTVCDLSCGNELSPAVELINNSNPSCNDILYSIGDSGNQCEIEKCLKPSGGKSSARILGTAGPIAHTFAQTSSDADNFLTICCWNINGLSILNIWITKLKHIGLANSLKNGPTGIISETKLSGHFSRRVATCGRYYLPPTNVT